MRLTYTLLVLLIFTLCGCSLSAPTKLLEINFINVGEGDSALLVTPNRNAILIDTGSPLAIHKIRQALKDADLNKLSYLIVTHPDLDHIGGAFGLFREFNIQELLDNGQSVTPQSTSNDVYRWYDYIRKNIDNYTQARSGDSILLDSVKLSILWPPPGELDSNWNKNSLVLLVEYANRRILLMGDALRESELALLSNKTLPPNIDVLKAGHHGSKFSGELNFISHISPKITIISVDAENIRGYPSIESLNNYAKYGEVYRTDLSGNIQISINEKGELLLQREYE